MPTTLPQFTLSCRTMVGDGPTDNAVRLENLNNVDNGNNINGAQKIFNLQNFPITPGGVFQTVSDGTVVTPTSIDELHGQVVLAVPPALTLQVSYYYFLFEDSTWTEFIINALQIVGLSTSNPSQDITTVAEGLLAPCKLYAAYHFAMRVASQTGLWYNQKLQERDEARDSISGKWLKIAAAYKKDADALRADFYLGAGRQLKASFAILEHAPRPYTPDR